MGTNYYWTKEANKCKCCGRSDKETIHIGKSSGGWCFALHVEPDNGIRDLPDWLAKFKEPDTVIMDEYDRVVTAEDMAEIITERAADNAPKWGKETLDANHAVLGPNNLLRAKIDDWDCIGHGAGTWDLCIGEFS